jgi:predicted tellurium resistance membrane protein TerC
MPKTAGADRALLAGGLYACVARLIMKIAGLYVDFRAQGDFWVLGACYLRGFRLYFEWFGLVLVKNFKKKKVVRKLKKKIRVRRPIPKKKKKKNSNLKKTRRDALNTHSNPMI